MIHDLETGRARRAVVRVAMVAALALTPVGAGAEGPEKRGPARPPAAICEGSSRR